MGPYKPPTIGLMSVSPMERMGVTDRPQHPMICRLGLGLLEGPADGPEDGPEIGVLLGLFAEKNDKKKQQNCWKKSLSTWDVQKNSCKYII